MALLLLALLAVVLVAVPVLGVLRWRRATGRLLADLDASRVEIVETTSGDDRLVDLPAAVCRYLQQVLPPGQPMVRLCEVAHEGEFNLGSGWKPFRSRQRMVICRPGFLWDATVWVAPIAPVRVHDALIAGQGVLHAALLGLIGVARAPSTPGLAEAELMRFLAEAVWHPTTLLPGAGVHWHAVDENSARAIISDGALRAELLFRFDAEGLVAEVSSESRERLLGGTTERSAWRGTFHDWSTRDGWRIPLSGEVAWRTAEGWRPYWRGRITRIRWE